MQDNSVYECVNDPEIDFVCHCKKCTPICSKFELNRPKIDEIKEKFGQARICLTYYIDGMQEILNRYELLSEYICELCGEPGSTRSINHWLSTQCNKCYLS